ncbi:CYAC3 protein, partial [Upupa epops]|nr:CYAC3 protein [Upupa epops]
HPIVAGMLGVAFPPFCIVLGSLGLVCVTFVSTWCQYWRGGFALDGSAGTFNWHPVLMVTAMVVLYGAVPWAGLLGCCWVLGWAGGARRALPASAPLEFSQWVVGFSTFLLPWAPTWLRVVYKPLHVFFGSTILVLALASCVSGINEKLFFSLKNQTMEYQLLPPEAVFANTLGLLLILFVLLVLAALARPSWKRPDADSPDSCQ